MDTSLCNGFDFPVGDKDANGSYTDPDGKTHVGWYLATKCGEVYDLGIHTGDDWNGKGGGNTDLGQPVYATASGKVLFADECPSPWGNVVMIEHRYYENGAIKTVYSQYSHLKEILIKKGQRVKRRQKIGSIGRGNYNEYPAHLHFEIRNEKMKDYPVDYWPSTHKKTVAWVNEHYEQPSEFVKEHRKLSLPCKEEKLAITVKNQYKTYLYKKGKLYKTYEIALGQQPVGRKEVQGDLKVPEGEYAVCEKTLGPFDTTNWVNAYLGTRWIRLNYPNVHDAKAGLKKKLITKQQYESIAAAIRSHKIPPKGTKLGGGIGIHGWKGKGWENDGDRALTWGCLSMHQNDLEEFYDWVDLRTKVVICP